MTLYLLLVSVFAGLLLAGHYKKDRLTTVLGALVVGWPIAWVFLALRARGWGNVQATLITILFLILLAFVLFMGAVVTSVVFPSPRVVY